MRPARELYCGLLSTQPSRDLCLHALFMESLDTMHKFRRISLVLEFVTQSFVQFRECYGHLVHGGAGENYCKFRSRAFVVERQISCAQGTADALADSGGDCAAFALRDVEVVSHFEDEHGDVEANS